MGSQVKAKTVLLCFGQVSGGRPYQAGGLAAISRNSEVVRKLKIWLYSQRWGFVSRGFLCLLFGGLWPGVLLCGDGGFFYVGAVVLPEFPQDSTPFEGDGSQDARVAPAFGLTAGNVVSHPGTSCVVGGGR